MAAKLSAIPVPFQDMLAPVRFHLAAGQGIRVSCRPTAARDRLIRLLAVALLVGRIASTHYQEFCQPSAIPRARFKKFFDYGPGCF